MNSNRLNISLTFLEPYRLIEWHKQDKRNTEPRYLRGQTFARWHNSKNGDGGRPYITGVLLRSQVIRAAEELLSLTNGIWDGVQCCNGEFKTEKTKTPPKFKRKRPTLQWNSKKCSREYPCPFCVLIGLFDDAGKRHENINDYHVYFGNLDIVPKNNFTNINDIGVERIINRVDQHTGKASDYIKIWEVVNDNYWKYSGVITLNDKRAESLLSASLKFVDRICGALCKIEIKEKSENEVTKKESPYHKLSKPFEEEINHISDEIVKEFKKQNILDKARILADAIRLMRSKEPDVIEILPEGKTEKGHHLWDIKIKNTPLRKYLKTKLKLDETSQWRDICDYLGSCLYINYKKNSKEYIPEKYRILGESEYYSEHKESDYFIPSIPEKAEEVKEFIFVGTLKSVTPFYVGAESEAGDQTSLQILIDQKGRYRIPRSSLRGILRRDLRIAFDTGCNVELGADIPCSCPVCIVMRKITIMDARSNFNEPPDIRNRIRMNPFTSTVDEGALFDMEVGHEGVEFPFVLRYRGKWQIPKELQSVLHYWNDNDGMLFLGGAESTGKGRFKLENLRIFQWRLNGEGLHYYFESFGLRGDELNINKNKLPNGLEETHLINKEELSPYTTYLKTKWQKVEYKVQIKSPLLSSDPLAALFDEENHDAVVFKKRKVVNDQLEDESIPAIKAETIRGIIRTAVGKRTDSQKIEHIDCTCELCSIFGNEHEVSKIRFEDLLPINSPGEKHMDHVAIDRYLGGAKERMKFDTYPLAGSPNNEIVLEGVFWMRNDISEDYRKHIISALADVDNGLFPIGGKAGSGYGWVSKVDFINAPDNFKKEFENEINKRVSQFTELSEIESSKLPEKPLPNINESDIYYPHYFLPPGTKVNREKEVVGHEKWNDNDLLSGKITCRLKTLTPLIIPDTEDDNAFKLKEKTKDHKSYRFFRIKDEAMIPGSSLRGMISSVYEALTNSCYRILDESKYISWRIDPTTFVKGFKPGRIIRENDKLVVVETVAYRLPLYDDYKTTIDNNFNKWKDQVEPKLLKYNRLKKIIDVNRKIAEAARINREYLKELSEYDKNKILSGSKPVHVKQYFKNRVGGGNSYDVIAILCDEKEPDSQSGFVKFTGPNNANIEKGVKGTQSGHIQDKNKWSLNILLNSDHQIIVSNKQKYPRPHLEIVKDEIKYTINKRCDRIFLSPVKNANKFEVPLKVQEQYSDIIREYEKNTENIDENFRTIFRGKELQDGDLVYFRPDKHKKGIANAVVPVSISRESATKPIGKKLPDDLRPCEREWIEDFNIPEELRSEPILKLFLRHPDGYCPACRLFGTTYYKGRVRFGFAHLLNRPQWLTGGEDDTGGPVTLPLLERPRPTWSIPSDEYDIPGRKFYLHHNGWQDVINEKNKKDQNNRTVESLDKNNEFEFEIFFENLEPWELGLMLYCLELEPGMAHKLGMGKPLGFGSAEIKVQNLKFFIFHNEKKEFNWYSAENRIADFVEMGLYEVDYLRKLRSLMLFPKSQYTVKYPVLKEDTKEVIEDYTYNRLKDEKTLTHPERIKILTKPWSTFSRGSKIATRKEKKKDT